MPMFLVQLKHELWKLFGKKRTYLGFGMFVLAQLVILLVFGEIAPKSYSAHQPDRIAPGLL